MLIELISGALGKDVVRDDLKAESLSEYDEEFAVPEPDEELALALDAEHVQPTAV
jgi:hypothetical protein